MKFYNVFTNFYNGTVKECYINNLNGRKFNSLYSYWYLKDHSEEKILEGFKMNSGDIFIDSGAFTAWSKNINIDVDTYINWINKYDEYISLFGQIDTIPPRDGNLKTLNECCQKTWQNYLYMIDRVKSPKKILYTFHFGEPFEWLDQALEFKFPDGSMMDYIAFGGLVGRSTKERIEFLDQCFHMIETSSNPNIKVHGFGVSSAALWGKYKFESCDSYTPGFHAAYGFTMDEFGSFREDDYQKVFVDKELIENMSEDERKEDIYKRQNERSKLLINNIEHWTNFGNSINKDDIKPVKLLFRPVPKGSKPRIGGN